MKHHNLYRIAMVGYWAGGTLLALGFLCVFIAILTGWDMPEGMSYLFLTTGVIGVAAGGIAHTYAIEKHKELKPLPKTVRLRLESEARTRRADLELENSLKEAEDQKRAIEGRVERASRPEAAWKPPDQWR